MLSITTSYAAFTSSRLAGSQAASPATSTADSEAAGSATGQSGDRSTISASARQLSEAQARADARSGLTFAQLAQKAAESLGQIKGEAYNARKQQHDSEAPRTDDPALLSRARQATDFLHGKAGNPFKGLSRDQLALVTYDDGGSFTVNERRAASQEADRQEFAWRQQAVRKAMSEYDSTGKMSDFFSETLEHYKDLPAIEQAQYPEGYEAKLQNWLEQDSGKTADSPQEQNTISPAERIFNALSKQTTAMEARLERVVPGSGLQRVASAEQTSESADTR